VADPERREDAGPSDHALLAGIGNGSEEAFNVFFDRWAPRLGRFLLRGTGSRETSEDLLHEVFLRVLRSAPRFEPRGSVASWIFRIGANVLYSDWRRRRGSRVVPLHANEAAALAVTTDEDPEARRVQSAFARDVAAALVKISESHRMVFRLKVEEGLTYAEIAAVVGCPVGTAKSRFHHAVRELRALLEDWADGEPHRR
jgi:RNA polymerase sigma-70 factor (ECF subfamily)